MTGTNLPNPNPVLPNDGSMPVMPAQAQPIAPTTPADMSLNTPVTPASQASQPALVTGTQTPLSAADTAADTSLAADLGMGVAMPQMPADTLPATPVAQATNSDYAPISQTPVMAAQPAPAVMPAAPELPVDKDAYRPEAGSVSLDDLGYGAIGADQPAAPQGVATVPSVMPQVSAGTVKAMIDTSTTGSAQVDTTAPVMAAPVVEPTMPAAPAPGITDLSAAPAVMPALPTSDPVMPGLPPAQMQDGPLPPLMDNVISGSEPTGPLPALVNNPVDVMAEPNMALGAAALDAQSTPIVPDNTLPIMPAAALPPAVPAAVATPAELPDPRMSGIVETQGPELGAPMPSPMDQIPQPKITPNKNLDIVNSISADLAPAIPQQQQNQTEPKKGNPRSTLLFLVLILIIGVILFVVGIVLASGGTLF
jgi:hypothetical protein